MSQAWRLTSKQSFLTDLLGLPAKESHQVLEKVQSLLADPRPDGVTKKKLACWKGAFRLRAGDYRVVYAFDDTHVSLLSLRRRNEDTYKTPVAVEHLGGADLEAEPIASKPAPTWDQILAPPLSMQNPLPEPLTPELLSRLRVPPALHAKLGSATTEEALLAMKGVPDEILLRVDQYLFEKPIAEALASPELVADSVDDLLRFKEGSLLGFLLKLDPEQEKVADWAVSASGPTLVKGGPGTGKSTIALYRCRNLLRVLPADPKPRILFTTYTKALVAFSKQLLGQLLGADAAQVDVRTADSLTRSLAGEHDLALASRAQEKTTIREAIEKTAFSGNTLQVKAKVVTVGRLGWEYILEEIGSIIEARGFTGLDQYLAAARPGRKVRLSVLQREAVWEVRDCFNALLSAQNRWTWQQMRRKAAENCAASTNPRPYDAVVVDEAQDLPVSTLRTLVSLCLSPSRLFLTADANQSIYGSGFRWTDVHEGLKFQGRTAVLRANYRSTEQIVRAAASYLGQSGLEPELSESPSFTHTGPLPAVRSVGSELDELALVHRFVMGASRELRLGRGGCAILTPFEETGRKLAGGLSERGIAAEFMPGDSLDLEKPIVKVITLKSAKGLEFPVVAIAGFFGSSYPHLPVDAPPEALAEALELERRTMYVAMTRAMRALLIVIPGDAESPLLGGFDPTLWNLGGTNG